jgi:hypothetical protein
MTMGERFFQAADSDIRRYCCHFARVQGFFCCGVESRLLSINVWISEYHYDAVRLHADQILSAVFTIRY